ncbi:MAG: hypothetical protein HDR35_02955 [Treponema sp.]|nr:hypothetical protein [Treponema sp.]
MIYEIIRQNIKKDDVLSNPCSGTSEVIKITDDSITYKRGDSKITIKAEDINSAYERFKGKKVTTSDLAKFNPAFSQKTHRCNASFFLMLMDKCNLTKTGIIKGKTLSIELLDIASCNGSATCTRS